MPLVILHHLLNVSVQLANKRGLKKLSAYFKYAIRNTKILFDFIDPITG
jgi:hypothetical protein